jgi:hypothetical protein
MQSYRQSEIQDRLSAGDFLGQSLPLFLPVLWDIILIISSALSPLSVYPCQTNPCPRDFGAI